MPGEYGLPFVVSCVFKIAAGVSNNFRWSVMSSIYLPLPAIYYYTGPLCCTVHS